MLFKLMDQSASSPYPLRRVGDPVTDATRYLCRYGCRKAPAAHLEEVLYAKK